MKTLKLLSLSILVALAGCDGDDGRDGTNGADGANGLNSLVVQTPLAVGNANCLNGGVQIDSGLDDNGNNTLESGEVDATEFVCSPTITNVTGGAAEVTSTNTWFSQAKRRVEIAQSRAEAIEIAKGQAKNVILFVGDGLGISTITAARIMAGQQAGLDGEEYELSFDKFPYSGFAKTYNVDAQTPDSAGTMTAMMSGVKTDVGVIGVAEGVSRGDCSSVSSQELVTALEMAEIAGKSTGVISTARITHATPAATYAKSADRNWEDVSDMPAEAVAAGCQDIAAQLVNFETNLEARFAGLDVDGIEVMFGGGRRHFLPKDAAFNTADAVSSVEGDRTDGRDLTAEWQAKYTAGQYVIDQAGFDAINPATTERVLGLFNESHMRYEANRNEDALGEPSLTQMTAKAIDMLANNDDGFFLMVESGRIDHGHHAGSAYNALTDTIEFAKAVDAAVKATNPEDTLIIVTADHSHVFTIAGYPKRGNPILGKVVSVGSEEPSLAADGLPYTTVGYTNGRGFKNLGNETNADVAYGMDIVNDRQDLTTVSTESSGFHQEALIPLSSETHAGEDVGVYAMGPGAHLVTGTNEQSLIFHVMNHAADFVNQADSALE
ncbi:alkaline phosphatase [Thalassotalea euphylliae]|uniref:Alkaline phosphatase n=1 Tax=Thalassotalea euphylliae TaxID=1655234 RepID=A0A3E0TWW7_9GAMM|nr:alkaline phosphatase [Thalassotalea euphylliae]REL28485.1 alkaline phosphatase [Thalassotalea euphylliae]